MKAERTVDSCATPQFVQIEADLSTERFRFKFNQKRRFWRIASFGWISNETSGNQMWFHIILDHKLWFKTIPALV